LDLKREEEAKARLNQGGVKTYPKAGGDKKRNEKNSH